LGLVAFSVLSLGDVAIKSVTQYMDTLTTGLYMNLFTIAFLLPVIFFFGLKKTFGSKTPKFHILRSLFMLGTYLSIIFTFNHLPLATSYTIGFLMPFILNILAFLLIKEKISIHRWITIIIAFSAVLIAMRPGIEPFNIGYVSCLFGVFCLACGSMSVKYISKDDHWLPFITYPMVIQTTIIIIIMIALGKPLLPNTLTIAPTIWLILGGFTFTIGLSLLPQGIKRIDASLFGSLFYIVFPWGVIYGYIFFGDVIDGWTILSAAIIVASGFYLFYREKREGSKLI
ncbi:MAG: DMT family transporter, partial [Pseudomonadota bacterium]